MTVKNATEFCHLVSNRLGWLPPGKKEGWREIVIEASKVKRKIATNPRLYTWENLEKAVELLHRERITPASPAAVCWSVERALKLSAVDTSRQQVDADTEQAIEAEVAAGDPAGWAVRLARSFGQGRVEVLTQWKIERGPAAAPVGRSSR